MDDAVFKTMFNEGQVPKYKCPACRKEALAPVDFVCCESAETLSNKENPFWDDLNNEYVFRMTLFCQSCKQTIFSHGDGFLDQDHELDGDDEWKSIWTRYFRPQAFFPSLVFIDFPSGTPEEVRKNLAVAASLYHSSPASACNSLRMAAEEILTSLGAPKPNVGKFIPFGTRIKHLSETSNEYVLLDAIRWLGNDGSHSGSVINHSDAEQAFRIVDLLVEETYSERKKMVQELAKQINESKGPVRGVFNR